MSNKEWDLISYNQSYNVEMECLVKKWEDLTKERPIEAVTYQQITNVQATQKKSANDIY